MNDRTWRRLVSDAEPTMHATYATVAPAIDNMEMPPKPEVLMGLAIPKTDGFETASRRTLGRETARILVITVTGATDESRGGSQAGCSADPITPASAAAFLDAISRALRTSAVLGEA